MPEKSPKERFLASKFAKPHYDLTVSDGFEAACDSTILQFIFEQPKATDPTKHWDAHSRLAGAREALRILKTLADPVEQSKPTLADSLNYKDKK